jgi:heme exporter protein A
VITTAPAAPVVQASGLARTFGGRAAVADVELRLEARDCLALFGPNGAGKTTLLRLVAGLLKPSAGSVQVHGVDMRRDARARGRVGLISHQSMLYPDLTVLENVVFSARLHGVADAEAAARRALGVMRIEDRANALLRTLSRGMQQRVSVARATVHGPDVVLLDEPYTGLDTVGAEALTGMLRGMRDGGAALVLVTHNVEEGLALATQAAVMRDGRVVRRDTRPAAGFDTSRFAADYRALVRDA